MRGPAASQFILVAAFVATVTLSLVLTALAGRALSAADFGFFALVLAVFALARDVGDLGTTATAARDIARDPRAEQRLLEALYYVRRIVAAALVLVALALAFLQQDVARKGALVLAAVPLAMQGATAYHASFQARQALLGPSLAAIGTQALLVLGCFALIMGSDALARHVSLLVALREIAFLLLLAWLGARLVGFRIVPRPHWDWVRSFYTAAGLWALAALLRHLLVQVDVLTVYLLRGDDELGAWAAAHRILQPVLTIPWMMVVPLVPVLATVGRGGKGDGLLSSALGLGLGVGAIMSVALLAAAPDIVALLYGGKYVAVPLDAATAMRWIALGIAPSGLTAVAAAALLAFGREGRVLAASAVFFVLKVAANCLLVPAWGFMAAAITAAIVEIGSCVVLCALLSLRGAALAGVALRSLLPASAAGLAAAGAVYWLQTPAIRLVAIAGVAVLAGAALLRSRTSRDYFRHLREASARSSAGVLALDQGSSRP